MSQDKKKSEIAKEQEAYVEQRRSSLKIKIEELQCNKDEFKLLLESINEFKKALITRKEMQSDFLVRMTENFENLKSTANSDALIDARKLDKKLVKARYDLYVHSISLAETLLGSESPSVEEINLLTETVALAKKATLQEAIDPVAAKTINEKIKANIQLNYENHNTGHIWGLILVVLGTILGMLSYFVGAIACVATGGLAAPLAIPLGLGGVALGAAVLAIGWKLSSQYEVPAKRYASHSSFFATVTNLTKDENAKMNEMLTANNKPKLS